MLTLAQHNVYRFIQSFIEKNQYAPTTAEIAEGIGIKSRGVVHRYLKALVDAGHIELEPNRKRNIRLKEENKMEYHLPLLGKIAAGMPIEAVQDNESVDIASMFLTPGRYALRVKGNSMIDEGIHDGDVIICQHADNARDGQIVVALVDNEGATLKKLRRNRDATITLIPANNEHHPQTYACDRVRVQGIFVGLLRMAR
ncbi:MAG: transcriptional repressor LexA [Pseudomonadota bacterium]|nr:transcriptional repressor LexA [Pseudomonadota bacterium]